MSLDGGGMLQTHGLKGKCHMNIFSLFEPVEPFLMSALPFLVLDWLMFFLRRMYQFIMLLSATWSASGKKGLFYHRLNVQVRTKNSINIISWTLLSGNTWAPGIWVKGLVVRRMGWLYITGWGAIKGIDPIWPIGGGNYRAMKYSAWALYSRVQVLLRSS